MSGPAIAADTRRQAHQVLAAFRFQLLQTSLAWIGLSPGQTLLIEHMEDFDVVSSNAEIAATQGKYSGTGRSVTLASRASTDALTKFWESNGQSPGVTLVFQTNLEAGFERDVSFPGDAPGIAYWEAAKQGAPIAPLREALARLLPASSLKTWVEAGQSDADFLDGLVRRVVWSTGQPAGAELVAALNEQLVGRLNTLGLPGSLANALASQLSDHVFERATDRDPDLRKLDAPALNTFLMDASFSNANVAWTLPPWATLTAAVELPQPCAPRTRYVAANAETLEAGGSLWIHGPSGCAKSTLAMQVASASALPWLLVEFREVADKRDILLRLSRTYSDLVLAGQISGVILDDLDADIVGQNATRFARFARWVRARGLKVIFTSSRPCSPTASSTLQLPQQGLVIAAYLEVEDVRFLAAAKGCPESTVDGWAAYVFASAALGHPQLVAAKVISLASRGWPTTALTEDLVGPASEAFTLTRAEARRRLMLDAKSAGRALLRRLACIQGKFDRPLAIGAAGVDPNISEPAASLDFLIGPWIENSPGSKKYLRLSPLLAGLNEDVSAEEAMATRIKVAFDVATRGPMDLEDLGIAFWNSVAAKNGWLLSRLHLSFLNLSEDDFSAVAQELSALTFFRTDRPIFADDLPTAVTLRIIQLSVAAATENSDVFRASVVAALEESAGLEPEDLRTASIMMTLMKALFARGTRVEWKLRLEWLAQFEDLVIRFPYLAAGASSPTLQQLRQDLGPETTISDFFIAIGAQTIQSVADLEDLFDAFGGLAPAIRVRRLKELRTFHKGYGLYVQQGWAAAWFAGALDPAAALASYERLAVVAHGWDDTELAAECLVAQTILLEEHLGQAEDALSRLDAALSQDIANSIMLRQKAKLLGHMNRYAEAAQILDALRPAIDAQTPVERMYALKEAAVAAGNTGDLQKAANLFEEAASAVDQDADAKLECHRLALRTESALCCWKMGAHREALSRYARVLENLPAIDPQSSDTAFMLHARVRFGAGWIDADASRPLKSPPPLKIGATAALDIEMSQVERRDRGPLEDVTLLLHAVALRLGHNDLFPSFNLAATTPDYHLLLRGAELDYALLGQNSKAIAGAVAALLASVAALRSRDLEGPPIGSDAADGTAAALRILMAGVAMRIYALGALSLSWWSQFVDDCQCEFGIRPQDLANLRNPADDEGLPQDSAWHVIRGLAGSRETQTPRDRFDFHLQCVHVATASAPALSVINALATIVQDDWGWVYDRQRFALAQPDAGLARFGAAGLLVDRREPGGLMAMMQTAAFVLRLEFEPSWLAAFERLGGKPRA